MKKLMTLGLMLSVLGLAGAGLASTASARTMRGGDITGVWRLDSRNDNRGSWNNGGSQWDDRNGGSQWGDQNDRNDRNGRNGNGSYGDNGFARGDRLGALPEVIQIEKSRRAVRVENQNGRLLREIAVGRHASWNQTIVAERTGVNGGRVTEEFSVANRGRQLVVHTTMFGPRGSREFTSIYERA